MGHAQLSLANIDRISLCTTLFDWKVLKKWQFSYLKAKSDSHAHLKRVLESIGFNDNICDAVAGDFADNHQLKMAEQWAYKLRQEENFTSIEPSERCTYIRHRYGFIEQPLSPEEADYPLAYGILVYTAIDQLYYMMSAIYQPQNFYCIAVDNRSSIAYKEAVKYLQECFSNINVMVVPPVNYCGFTVLLGVQLCLRYLASSSNKWQYYQYLSGYDLPLRTNHEMVRIFKRLNGSFNCEILQFPTSRLKHQIGQPTPYGVKMFKSSLSATFSRASADFIATSIQARKLLLFLRGTECPDESFWATIAGNNDKISMPGAFNGTELWLAYSKGIAAKAKQKLPVRQKIGYYISRYQSWQSSIPERCHGEWSAGSCIFGVGDVNFLLKQPHLVAHKFRLTVQPLCYFCIYKKVRERAVLGDINEFNDEEYGELPSSKMIRGEGIDQWFIDYYRNT